MRKYNEGYTLPFVLVVFLVTSLVAVSILTVSIHNLHGQKASVTRMEAQYAAQGEIEKVNAILQSSIDNEGDLDLSPDILKNDFKSVVADTVFTLREIQSGGKVQGLELQVVTTKGTLEVDAVFDISGGKVTTIEDDGYTTYTVEDVNIEYKSYTISNVESTTEESTGGE